MDKLLQRTRMVERQASRRQAKERLYKHSQMVSELRRDQKIARTEVKQHLRAAVKARRQDWKMGPLAPKRDASIVRSGKMWGTIGPQRARPGSALLRHDLEARCAWAGGSTLLCLAKNDRVAVVEGWLRGRITTVKEIYKSTGCVGLGDIANVSGSALLSPSSPPPFPKGTRGRGTQYADHLPGSQTLLSPATCSLKKPQA
jgi:large subunit ribosomal protein L24